MNHYAEQHIMMNNCCPKETVKKVAKYFTNKTMTDIEAILIVAYATTISVSTCAAIIQFKFVARFLTWIFTGFLSHTMIIMIAVFVNIIIILQMIDCIKEMLHAIWCKCEYKQLPELVEEDASDSDNDRY
jgi:hypothetical protein